MSLCLVLLLAATLCLRSLLNARSYDPGFEPRGRVVAELNLKDFGFDGAQSGPFFARLIEAVRGIPGVRSAAWTRYLPLGTEHSNGSFVIESSDAEGGKSGFFERFGVGPGYFATMGTSLLQGRDLQETDTEGAPRVILINEAAATRYWPGINPVGRRLNVDGAQGPVACEIVGVVKTGCYRTLWEDSRPAFFECLLQSIPQKAVLVARVDGDAAAALRAIEKEVRRLDARLALSQATTLEEHLSVALFPLRASGMVLGGLGALALVLAVSGLFGVMAYSVSRRTREVGIRMALGARPGVVLRVVLSDGMKLATVGVVLGIGGALIAMRVLRGLLFGISATDPVAFVLIPLMLLGVAWMACWVPARRASRVDPVVALRAE
jgi:predicted permease